MNTFKNFIKQYFFMLALVGIAVGFSAFKAHNKRTDANVSTEDLYWFEYVSTDPYSPGSYQKYANQGDAELCDGETEICAIRATELSPGSSMPAISSSPSDPLRAAIQDAHDNQSFNTNYVVGLP